VNEKLPSRKRRSTSKKRSTPPSAPSLKWHRKKTRLPLNLSLPKTVCWYRSLRLWLLYTCRKSCKNNRRYSTSLKTKDRTSPFTLRCMLQFPVLYRKLFKSLRFTGPLSASGTVFAFKTAIYTAVPVKRLHCNI